MSTSKASKVSKFWTSVAAIALVGAGVVAVSQPAHADGTIKFSSFMKKMNGIKDDKAGAAFDALKGVCDKLKDASDECQKVTGGDKWKTAADAKGACDTCHSNADKPKSNDLQKKLKADADVTGIDMPDVFK
jgi:hypothetical protein